MSLLEHSLEGDFHFKMDPKGRVAVPAAWCLNQEEKFRLMVSKCHGVPTLKILRQARFEEMLEEISQQAHVSVAARNQYRSRLFKSCMPIQIGGQSKLLIPRTKCPAAELEPNGDVALVGQGNYFEIMSEANYGVMEAQQVEDTADLNDELGYF